ncbi:hypothetical protein BKA67DRAFT_394493 [Truncatella angustata]|uniref:FabD/lysophospholipase-like protein n=1 Tax=Truncatella angustata TaxID=152316 RepID=A0A9P8RQM8_9PEZI|nr:uncharacterized protein BKA67DRAFT_394493 [Truncatella angustata]KAH6647653.1 hypothetical protein BKA67DRAFT_394493 [Truncatella angustata]
MASEHPGLIPAVASQPCRTCGTVSEKRYSCVQCNNLWFCDGCWNEWVLHVPGAVGWGGRPHEKANPEVVYRLRQIFEPVRSEADHEQELLDDEETAWFGYGRDSVGHPVFQDYGRFAAVMGESHAREVAMERYPQLVTFIGETGAGKSSLVKMLIDRQDIGSAVGGYYRTPVTSSGYDRLPTTGDVHLYPEPSTYYSDTPLLLADCEGLNGGEMLPKALRYQTDEQGSMDTFGAIPKARIEEVKNRKMRKSSPRQIVWADNPQNQKREYAVSVLYPRILYSFSDVVVFVLRNPRAFESVVLEKLVRWGAESIDKSLNQPVLPHAVIVFNASEFVDDREWDPETATAMLMQDIKGAIFREPALKPFVQSWIDRGRSISTTEELLQCYYASVTVMRFPSRGQYMLMDQQAGRMTDLIKQRCAASHLQKRQVRMLANAERLQVYLQAAFDHFTRDLSTPFDFVKEALKYSPSPRDFGGNILSLAVAIKERATDEAVRNNAQEIFHRLGPMIATCVMFDAVRQSLMGTAAQLLDDAYAEPCIAALHRFADMHWPCAYRRGNSMREEDKCCNVKIGHNPKGHQNSRGSIIGHGSYQSSFDATRFGGDWSQVIRENLLNLQNSVFNLGQSSPGRTELQVAGMIHRERINEFYKSIGNASDFVSHVACFSCLRELPECALPCGHILCLPCVKTYGKKTSKTTIEISRCPLHVQDVIADPPWVIPVKPARAGVRILCLDGGGVRSIVELQVLKAIKKVLGPKLPLQLFFDLIVGSGTGGTIALGLSVKNWSVEECIKRFKELSSDAFSPRELTGIPMLENLAVFYHGSIYKTRPFERGLKMMFQDQPLFGGATLQRETPAKVAVLGTTTLDQRSVVFANYNRQDQPEESLPYRFLRTSVPGDDIKVWEAARAVSAQPPLFKPFQKPETKIFYTGTSTSYNCPALIADYESSMIWSDMKDAPADVLLSIGSGKNIKDNTPAQLSPVASTLNNVTRRNTLNTSRPLRPSATVNKLDDYSSNDKVWDRFIRSKSLPKSFISTEEIRQRYIRINPALDMKIPKLDAARKVYELEREAREVLQSNVGIVKEAAHRLIASSFFFEKTPGSVKQTALYGYECSGTIHCRFPFGSDEMKALGEFLRSTFRGEFEPYFLLEEEVPRSAPLRIPLEEGAVHDMCHRGHFEIEPLYIQVQRELATTKVSLCLQGEPYPSGVTVLPISGFPRQLISEDKADRKGKLCPLFLSPTYPVTLPDLMDLKTELVTGEYSSLVHLPPTVHSYQRHSGGRHL